MNFPLHLERSCIALKDAIKTIKNDPSLLLEAHHLLLNVLMVTLNYIDLERELGILVSGVSSTAKALNQRVERERNEIRKLQRKTTQLVSLTGRSRDLPRPAAISNASELNRRNLPDKSKRKPALSDSQLEIIGIDDDGVLI